MSSSFGTIAATMKRVPWDVPATVWRLPHGRYLFTVDWWAGQAGHVHLVPHGSVAVRRKERLGEWVALRGVSRGVAALAGWIHLDEGPGTNEGG